MKEGISNFWEFSLTPKKTDVTLINYSHKIIRIFWDLHEEKIFLN